MFKTYEESARAGYAALAEKIQKNLNQFTLSFVLNEHEYILFSSQIIPELPPITKQLEEIGWMIQVTTYYPDHLIRLQGSKNANI